MNHFKGMTKLEEEPIFSLLFKLSVPAIIGMLIQALYNVVDSIYIGQFSKEALTALSLAFPIQMILIAIALGTGIGSSSLISRLLGRKREGEAIEVISYSILIILLLSAIIAIVGYFFSYDLIKLLTSDRELIKLGGDYTRIILLGSSTLFFPIIIAEILRGEGNTFIPMLTMIVGAILNIILDPLFIFGTSFFPQLGVEGAAYATVISRLIASIFIGIIFFKRKSKIKLRINKLNFKIIYDIYKVGFPVMLMQILSSLMITGVNKIVAAHHILAIPVVGIFFRLYSFVLMPVFGLSQGYMPIVGYNYGNNNHKRTIKTIKMTFIIACLITIGSFIIFQIFSKELVSLFNNDPELLSIGEIALKRISISFPLIGLGIISSSTFQAIGKGLPSLILSFLRQIILLLPIMYLLGSFFGLDSLWFAFPIAESISTLVIIVWLLNTMQEQFGKALYNH